jgi:putative ABC transport system ATP-binding protein
MIEMHHLSKVYRRGLLETHPLRDVSISIRDGEFVSVAGNSGSGKTTFLNVTGLLDGFTGGTYHLNNVDVSALNDTKRSQLRNEQIGFVFQSSNLLPDLNVFDNCALGLSYRRLDSFERKRRIDRALGAVGISYLARRSPTEMSGGQMQCVAIARAMAGEPRLILMDEPTANLDSTMANHVLEVLKEVNRLGTTIIMVSHNTCLSTKSYVFSSGLVFTEFAPSVFARHP